jgi:MFS family permease
MVSTLFRQKKTGPYFDINTITDARFALLATGGAFVALGELINDTISLLISPFRLGIFVPFFYIVEYAKYLSIPDHMAFYTLAVMNAGGVLGRIAPAYLSDSLGRFNLLIPSAFLSGLLCLVFWLFAKSLVSIMLFSVIYGFVSGSFVSVVTPCVAQISDMAQMGTRIGMLYSILSFP